MPYWYTEAQITISQELIAKMRGEHWDGWPLKEASPSIKPRLDAIEWRKKHGCRQKWQRLTDDELRAYYADHKLGGERK